MRSALRGKNLLLWEKILFSESRQDLLIRKKNLLLREQILFSNGSSHFERVSL